ncbi:tRNA (adenosine(37)-N6)-threonylcarbamoyltransferase complex dimerization subunit type 1 TsaB [Subtercola boreus]|uniref:tRNA (Adenosine(37)-N6)-threonylcarbamoyltransferase complex dimerization subunit type 1 TsaB n=1 Tax=Subtercola boreus TaxID=120213 RepID=A0A3E0WBA2_9MICO|nr:tRNA (adenosine(37)-N6)-threonylcarbamoyltransferase complex dimerization subunit type 1 TsaB [Subtercola boreus]RFA19507.1 tRNA (adenosine(37)-N6)-threonylcarbamoyltransferase complex dimerization subunit type 1 TsaB [Subtercola boreus]RFA19767.1 tRNA (adenosine(37)-N6)-threonylcarbamoyltransferase complex dimerization subunit type 1 TsaB [Subtercola boreus]RFA26134.1 tRNA (adenosine(37)-N6)-threonylcarbamoyltransferase complex dimerization subunit type 1 TsaB [Subtercola boreus]
MLLAIDTSAGTSVSVVREGSGILSQADGHDTMKHAEVIGRLIERALTEAGVRVDELTGVVAGMGPGPFTGLRVGIAAARVFALGRGVPLYPVVSHDAIALAEATAGAGGELLVVTDARRREVYWSLYELAGAAAAGDGVGEAADASGAGAGAGASAVRLDGPGLAKPDALPHPGARTTEAARVSAGQLGLVALALLASGGDFAADRAIYLRSPDVTVSTGVKRVTQ